MKTLLIKLYI